MVEVQNETIQELNREIYAVNAQLVAQNEEIKKINNYLDQRVQERTAALEKRNNQLAAYAATNLHELRAPVARLLGLSDLLLNVAPETFDPQMIVFIRESTQTLDQVITRINDQVSEMEEIQYHNTGTFFINTSQEKAKVRT